MDTLTINDNISISYFIVDPCKEDPCKNGGTCFFEDDSFRCICKEEFVGETCELENRCVEGACVNGGTCVQDMDFGNIVCKCPKGFGGGNCEIDLQPCLKQNCTGRGVCNETSVPGEHRCLCDGKTR